MPSTLHGRSSATGSDPGSLGYIMFNMNLVLIILSTALFALRMYTRTRILKVVGIDDYFAGLAWVGCLVLSAMDMYLVKLGVGKHIQTVSSEELVRFFDYLPRPQITFFIVAAAVRLAIASFLPRLCNERLYLRLVYSTAAFIVVVTLACFFAVLTECQRIGDLFDTTRPGRVCMSKQDEAYIYWVHSAVGIVIDIMLIGLPVWIIRKNLRFSRRKTIQVMLVFGVGVFAVATGIVKLIIMVSNDFGVDTTYKMVTVAPWADIEVHVGLWVACFPSLKPFLRLVSFRLGFRDSPERSLNYTPHPYHRSFMPTGKETYAFGTTKTVGDEEMGAATALASLSQIPMINPAAAAAKSDDVVDKSGDDGDSLVIQTLGKTHSRITVGSNFEMQGMGPGKIGVTTPVYVESTPAEERRSWTIGRSFSLSQPRPTRG